MALPNGDLITTVFDPQMAYPVDKRMQVDTLNSRDSISMFIRWEGMTVYVLENSKIYILQGGRSNEFWKELGTGSGTGGTTFVGQFPTADLLPTSGRSAGDYAFVGTGDDFVQYNWDNIANEWVMAEGQTDMASEFFHIGYKTPLRRPVIFPLFPKDVLVQESGDFVFAPETSVARFIFVGEVTAIRGIETAASDREIKLVNRTGSDIILRDKATGIPSGSGMDFGGTDYTWVNGSEITPKGNGTYWQLAANNQVAFSDHLDSVNAQVSVGSDGLEVITGIFDRRTGESIVFKETIDSPDIIDGIIYILIYSKIFKRVTNTINVNWFGVTSDNPDVVDNMNFALEVAERAMLDVFVPDGIYWADVSEFKYISPKSNMTINMSDNAVFRVIPNSLDRYYLFYLSNIENVNIIGGKLIGDRNEHEGSTGQWGYGILIRGGKNINLENITSNSFWGDGLTLGKHESIYPPVNVNVYRCNFDDNRRQGISIVSGDGVYIDRCTTSNTYGHSPESGIDVEPDNVGANTKNVHITNCISFGNNGDGIIVTADTEGISVNGNTCYENSRNGIRVVELLGRFPDRTSVIDNTCFDNTLSGIRIERSVSVNCISNNVYGNLNSGIYITGANNCKILYNNITDSGSEGIYVLGDSVDVDITGNKLSGHSIGIRGVSSSHLKITKNTTELDSNRGIQLFGCHSMLIHDNTIKESTSYGIVLLEGSNLASVFNNFINSNSSFGILGLQSSVSKINIRDNYISGISSNAIYIDSTSSQIDIGFNDYSEFSGLVKVLDQGSDNSIYNIRNKGIGPTAKRPTTVDEGFEYYNTSISKPTWRTSSGWVELPDAYLRGHVVYNSNQSIVPGINDSVYEAQTNSELTFTINQESAYKRGVVLEFRNNGLFPLNIVAGTGVTITGGSIVLPSTNDYVKLVRTNLNTWRIADRSIFRIIGQLIPNLDYTFVNLDKSRYNRLTNGTPGTAIVPPSVFTENDEIVGEVEGGTKTFVAGTGVTLRFPTGQGLIAPTGSRFIIKFKSPDDALVTIIKPYISATTFPALTDTPANYTGHKNKSVKVNNEETALVFVADGVDVRNITDGGSIAPTLTDGFIGSRLNFTSSTAVTLQGFTSSGSQSSLTLVNPHATNNLTLVHNGAGTVKYIDAGATDLVIAPKTAVKLEIVGNEIYRVL